MTPWEWLGIVMARSDTQCRTSADGRSAVIRCSGRRRSAGRERAHELRAGFGRCGVLNGRRHLPALVGAGGIDSRAFDAFVAELPGEPVAVQAQSRRLAPGSRERPPGPPG